MRSWMAGRPRMAVPMVALLLAACAGPPLPPLQWWRLPAEPGVAQPAPPAADPAVSAAPAAPTVRIAQTPQTPQTAQTLQTPHTVWQLVGGVALPAYLDRDTLLVPDARGALQPREGARWAEPLRDAVPRLLRHDLARLLGAPLWTAPLPPGVVPTRQLRLELLALDLQPGLRELVLHAHYSLTGPGLAPRSGELALVQPLAATDTAALVQAHRDALAQLAQRLAALMR